MNENTNASQIELDKLQEYIKGNIVEFLKEYYS